MAWVPPESEAPSGGTPRRPRRPGLAEIGAACRGPAAGTHSGVQGTGADGGWRRRRGPAPVAWVLPESGRSCVAGGVGMEGGAARRWGGGGGDGCGADGAYLAWACGGAEAWACRGERD